MNYEQKYKNLVERLMKAKEDYDIADERYRCVIDGLIPEPRESENERIRRVIIADIQEHHPNWMLYEEYTSWIDWLKKQGEQRYAWSEEDEKMIGCIRGIIERYAFSQSAVDVNGDLCEREFIEPDEWLKSLKDRGQPHPAWKPTEEQMKAIKYVAEQNRASEIGNILDNLLVEIKNM